VLRVVLRNVWLGGAAVVAIFTAINVLGSKHPFIDGAESVLAYALMTAIAWRFGLLAVGMYIFSSNLVEGMQSTLRTGAWYFGHTLFLGACVLALAIWGCYTSLAGQKLWKTNLFET